MAIAEWKKLVGESNEGNVYNTIGDLYLNEEFKKRGCRSICKSSRYLQEKMVLRLKR